MDPVFHMFDSIILGRFCIMEGLQGLPKKTGKTLPVKGIGVKMSFRIPKDIRRTCHLQQECKW
jgi:hypothetical protein